VNLLIDENLSPKLVQFLAPGSEGAAR